MTCSHILDLIDAGSFAGATHEQLEVVSRHARHCRGCAAALAASKAIATELARLPHPAPSPELAAAVLARIARTEQAGGAPAEVSARKNRATTRGWSAWAAVTGCVVAELATVLSTQHDTALSDSSRLDFGVMAGGGGIPLATTSAVVLGAALVLYAAGLFASLRQPGRQS